MRSVYKHSWKTLTAGSLFCFSFIPERVTTADNNQDLGWNRGVIRFPLFMLPIDSLVLSFCGKPIFDAHFLTCKCIKLDLNWSGRNNNWCMQEEEGALWSQRPPVVKLWNCSKGKKKQQTVFNTETRKLKVKFFPHTDWTQHPQNIFLPAIFAHFAHGGKGVEINNEKLHWDIISCPISYYFVQSNLTAGIPVYWLCTHRQSFIWLKVRALTSHFGHLASHP